MTPESKSVDRRLLEDVQGELARLTVELGTEEQRLDVLFLAYLLKTSRFGFFTFGPVTIDVRLIEDIVRRTHAGAPKRASSRAPYADDCLRFFDVLSREVARSGRHRIDEAHFLLAFMSVGEGLPSRVFAELGVSPDDVRHYVPSTSPSGREPEKLFSPDEAAAYLNVHVKTVRNWIRDGRLPASRLAGQRALRIRLSDLEQLLEPLTPEDLSVTGGEAG